VDTTASATTRTPSSIQTQVGVLLTDFLDEAVVTVVCCVVVCWTVVVTCTVVVVSAVVVVGTVVVVVVVTVVFVGAVWAIPFAGASEPASTTPLAKSAANEETLSKRGRFLSIPTWFPSPGSA
jgi:ABC-type multidrug transport system fused ATPase/permease subunit